MTAVAIDGPAGAGKSTVAKQVAARLGYLYVDTGAMYRAVALAALENGVDLGDGVALGDMVAGLAIVATDHEVLLDGRDVGRRIREPDVTAAVSTVSAHPQVRAALVEQQRLLAHNGAVVMEGRDIGSHVLPEAEVKVFLTASLDERARRRWLETGGTEDLDAIRAGIERRDRDDSARAESPLVQAEGAVAVDTDGRTIESVVDEIVALATGAAHA